MALPFAVLLPTLGPAVAGSVLYGVFSAILIWRTHQSHRFSPYILLSIFTILRTVGFACRAAWSQNLAAGISPLVYVANILQYAGFILEIMAVINLVVNWVRAELRQGAQPPRYENLLFTILRVIVVAAQIVTIVGAVTLLVGAGGGNLHLVSVGTDMKNASFYGFFGATLISLLLALIYYVVYRSHAKLSHLLLLIIFHVLLLVKLVFRIVALNLAANNGVNTREVFYFCLDALPEFIYCMMASVIDLTIVKNGYEPWKKQKHAQQDVEKAEVFE
ncbi:hypothetical protein BZG36_02027 [Bifiguratus adelaidae]|uniref:THH1/TOM1/TOM3 domain-containing protein n=1 Tax=Bifiguratus adelaidae TaxID=1938954 RepID=A0A261Y205_9FUNG|nr:hypothetical protein BZG36_02027 [Bifiguratus adelaidae]